MIWSRGVSEAALAIVESLSKGGIIDIRTVEHPRTVRERMYRFDLSVLNGSAQRLRGDPEVRGRFREVHPPFRALAFG